MNDSVDLEFVRELIDVIYEKIFFFRVNSDSELKKLKNFIEELKSETDATSFFTKFLDKIYIYIYINPSWKFMVSYEAKFFNWNLQRKNFEKKIQIRKNLSRNPTYEKIENNFLSVNEIIDNFLKEKKNKESIDLKILSIFVYILYLGFKKYFEYLWEKHLTLFPINIQKEKDVQSLSS